MLLGNSESFPEYLGLFVHVNSLLWVLGVDEALFSLTVVRSLEVEVSLVEEDFSYGFGVVLTSNLESVVPVLLVFVHVDGFLRFVRFNEFFFRLFDSVFIFKM